MKTCSSCGQEKVLSDFGFNRSKKDGRQSFCRKCKKEVDGRYYLSNKSRMRRQITQAKKRAKASVREFLREYLGDHPCVDCGEDDLLVLEFDHVRGRKKYTISSMVSSGMGLETLKREIAKCDVRCANCHKKRTNKLNGSWRKGC